MTKYYKIWINQDNMKCHPLGVNPQPFDLSDMTQACTVQGPANEACPTGGIQGLAAVLTVLTGVTSLNLYVSGWEW